MGRRLYVGNLPYKATDEDLTTLFSSVGDVASAQRHARHGNGPGARLWVR